MTTDSRGEHRHHSTAADKEETSHAPPKKKRRRWWLLATLAALATVVWLLPGIVAHSPLLPWGVKRATAQFNGSVSVQSASLGWLSPVAVHGIEVKDAAGKTVFTLADASDDRTLAGLLWNYTNLGRIRLESPKLSLVLRDDGSNAEDLLAKYLTPKTEPAKPSAKVGLSLEIVDGSLSLTDQRTGRSWQVDKLAASVEMPDGPDGPLTAKLSTDLPDARQPGKLTAGLKMASGASEATLNVAGLPLAMFRALAARFAPGTTCDGRLSADLTASWGGQGAAKNSLRADLSTEGFSLGTPALQTDVVQLDRLHAVCQVSWQADRVEVERSSLECELGNVSLSSTVRRGEKDGLSFASLLRQRHELTGGLDVARLARLLPATLHLRQNVQINSGQVQLALSSKPEQQGMTWHGQLNANRLTATASGRQIAWQQPISLAIDAHQSPGGAVVDALRCESDFLKIHANGTTDALAASLTFNLKQLSDQLSQFVDLGALQLAGEGGGNLNWKRSPQQVFDADADLRLHNFQVALPNQPPWRENDLIASFSAKGQTDFSKQTRIDTAGLNVKSGTDQLEVRLAQSVKDLSNGGALPLHLHAQGQLENWPGRLAAWLPMQNCRLAGGYTLVLDGTAAADRVELRQATATVVPLAVTTPWLRLNEPRLDATLAGSWNQAQRRLQIGPGALTCGTTKVDANNLVLVLPEKGPLELGGTLKYQGDAAQIRQWLSDPAKPSTWRLAGQISGVAELHQTASVVRGETTTDLTNLTVVDASGQQFQEPRVRLAARGDYNSQTGVVQLEQFQLASDVLGANAKGRIAPVSGTNNADLSGQIDYDLERVAGLLRPYLGPGVRLAGHGSSPAWYRGPFSLATGQSAASLKWDGANVYGLQVGPGELKAGMANGAVQIEPLDLSVSRGRMHLAPSVRLVPAPIELSMPKGPLAQQIQIDPTLCATMLKYIAPVLADVATAQGSFSIDLDGCRLPLGDLAKGELAGRFTIHTVEIGAGPLVRELAVFHASETPAKLRQESVVLFRMVGGRVYHQGLELMFPNLTIRTYGSVGLDQTMAIMAELPVPPKWLEKNNLISQALRDQVIRVPIAGTLSKPQLDKKAMQDLTRQFMQRATQNLLEGETGKVLDRLFGPKK
jgi:translocation and assembly module TamB